MAVIIWLSYLINLPFLFVRKIVRQLISLIFATTLFLSSILDLLHVFLFKSRVSSSSYYSMFATNTNEALEFILDYSSWQLLIGLFLCCLFPFLFFLAFKKLKSILLKKIMTFSFVLIFILVSGLTFLKSEISYCKEISMYKFYNNYKAYKKDIKFLSEANATKSTLNVQKTPIDEMETYIIIIGESTSKYHMQLYGYNRNTNPELMKIKDELTVFNHVKSTSAHTIQSIQSMLILTDSNNRNTPNTLIDCFNNVGFTSYWLSNQAYLGSNETVISALAKKAKKQLFINATGGNKFDEELLPKLDGILSRKEKKKVVFIHLIGTHLDYQDRYPKKFNVFKSKNISIFGEHADNHINQYDNAILYNDFVVSEIIKKVKKVSGLTAVINLSDHGDEVYDYRNFHGHSGGMLSKYMNSIPFFIWNNNAFEQLNKTKLIAARKNADIKFSLKNLSNTVQDLFDIHSEYYDSNKSFLNENQHDFGDAITNTLSPVNSIEEFPTFTSKIWVHRVNSIERLKEVQDKFKGIELDIVFENGEFDVRHPPATSIQLSLDKYFSKVKNVQQHYFWLDLKNLNEQNLNKVINRLNKLTDKYGIKKNLIVESTAYQLLPKLNQNNFLTSYYLPNYSALDETTLNSELILTNHNIGKYRQKALSQSIDNYVLMNENFEMFDKLIWALNLDWNDNETHQRIESLLKRDSTIKVCLVNYHTKGWR